MSYPYQQGQPPQGMPGAYPPYPQQPSQTNYPGGQAPYPQQTYPQSQAPYPNQFASSFDFTPGPPSYMPQPYSMPMPMHSQPAIPQSSPYIPPSPVSSEYAPPPSNNYGYATTSHFSGYAPPASQSSSGYAPPPSQSEYVPLPVYSGVCNTAPPQVSYSSNSRQNNSQRKGTPTVFPADPFNPRADAETLRKAMKGFGTDEKAIIQVLANRTNSQRLEIGIQFKTLYGKDLNKDLKSELSGRFEDLVLAMMTPLPQFYAKEIHEALSGIGTDEDTLIEVFCTMTNNEIHTIRAAYEYLYRSSLENDLAGDTSGTFRRLMISLCTGNRDESMMVNPTQVTQDAQALLRAGEMRMGTDESTFNAVLCQRNYCHLRAVFEEYERITGHEFEKAIKNEFSGDSEEGLLAIVRSVKDKSTFFAKRIHESMKGMGTNDRQLIRLVVTRSEVDMSDIKQAYQAKYGQSLSEAISGDTSGDYKKCLIALIS